MMRAELTVDIHVRDDAERAWRGMTDWSRQGEWMIGTKVRTVGGPAQDVGGRLRAVTGVAGVGVVDLMEITEWDPPRRCSVRHVGRVLRGEGVFEVIPEGTGSRVVWSESLQLPCGRVGRWGWPLARPFAELGLRMSLHRFARWMRDYA